MALEFVQLAGKAFHDAIPELADLRIKIFREWPYLYDGDMDYETRYLERFVRADRAFLVVAKDGHNIVGAATAAPLAGEAAAFREPLEVAGFDIERIFYFAESLILPQYRGQGAGHVFFDLRQAHARSFGTYEKTVFCGVVRPDTHPEKPKAYRKLDGFWQSRGYRKLEGVTTSFSWKDAGETAETAKPMQFWMGEL